MPNMYLYSLVWLALHLYTNLLYRFLSLVRLWGKISRLQYTNPKRIIRLIWNNVHVLVHKVVSLPTEWIEFARSHLASVKLPYVGHTHPFEYKSVACACYPVRSSRLAVLTELNISSRSNSLWPYWDVEGGASDSGKCGNCSARLVRPNICTPCMTLASRITWVCSRTLVLKCTAILKNSPFRYKQKKWHCSFLGTHASSFDAKYTTGEFTDSCITAHVCWCACLLVSVCACVSACVRECVGVAV